MIFFIIDVVWVKSLDKWLCLVWLCMYISQ